MGAASLRAVEQAGQTHPSKLLFSVALPTTTLPPPQMCVRGGGDADGCGDSSLAIHFSSQKMLQLLLEPDVIPSWLQTPTPKANGLRQNGYGLSR